MKRNRWMAAALAGLLVVATACGSDNDCPGAACTTASSHTAGISIVSMVSHCRV